MRLLPSRRFFWSVGRPSFLFVIVSPLVVAAESLLAPYGLAGIPCLVYLGFILDRCQNAR